jgi:nickel-dependent lactate racemase
LIGTISAEEIKQITNGLMAQEVPVRLNKLIFDYDQLIVCGPVFPHEVVGFSGGNKYFFPGIAGPEIINFTHWLGAVITNYKVIGAGYTPAWSSTVPLVSSTSPKLALRWWYARRSLRMYWNAE